MIGRYSKFVALTLVVFLAPATVTSARTEQTLTFYHTHTRESLTVTFLADGEFIESAMQELNHFLADFRTGDTTAMDPELLSFIYDVRQSLGSNGVYEVISAYRSPATNDMLRRNGSGVARNSQHLLGKAIDVRLRGVDTGKLRDAAIALQRGGVGYYKESDFVHMDTGRVRRW